ncbi:MAG: copper amine oxidase N-terminal domain-containing protein, partial [Clostridiales bacterium]|nr:copper amine oxidase N-terminal domain-containing protein [Clostridiales bacterium]
MKKLLSLILTLVLVVSLSSAAFAVSEKSNGKNTKTTSSQEKKESTGLINQFRTELSTQKKEAIREKSSINRELEQAQIEYDALVAAGDTAGADAKLASINDLKTQIADLNTQIKEINKERFMVAKTLYTSEELKKFQNAAELINQMYADANTLQAGSVIIKNNIIKFDAPPYIKGGKTVVPVRAITEGLGAEVTYDAATKTVTITKDTIVVKLTVGSKTADVNGVATNLDATAPITCSRTYV